MSVFAVALIALGGAALWIAVNGSYENVWKAINRQ